MSEPMPTLAVAAHVYGDGPALDDPAETFHEASRLSPRLGPSETPGLALLLAGDPVLHASVSRASRRFAHRPAVELGSPCAPETPLAAVLAARRSRLAGPQRPLRLRDLSAVLACGYGSHETEIGDRRHVPSGGALYPLELYVSALDVEDVPGGLYHYDPYAHRLEQLHEGDGGPELASLLIDPAPAALAAAAILVTGVFWRSRFKYGQRGYRFTLIEAGHVGQNVVLAAAALGLHALPIGGFYDRRADDALGVDGVDEATLYVLLLGGGEA